MIGIAIDALKGRARGTALMGLVTIVGLLATTGSASSQYGSGAPLPAIPPVPVVNISTTAGSAPSGVPAAVGGGEADPADNTSGEGGDTGAASEPTAGEPTAVVQSTDVARPVVAQADSLPFTGARIGVIGLIGLCVLLCGIEMRRRSAAHPGE